MTKQELINYYKNKKFDYNDLEGMENAIFVVNALEKDEFENFGRYGMCPPNEFLKEELCENCFDKTNEEMDVICTKCWNSIFE